MFESDVSTMNVSISAEMRKKLTREELASFIDKYLKQLREKYPKKNIDKGFIKRSLIDYLDILLVSNKENPILTNNLKLLRSI